MDVLSGSENAARISRVSLEDGDIVVAVDTREQKPYRFPHWERKTLYAGDYSIIGLENEVAVERKTKSDAYSCLGSSRCRFERELVRLTKFDYAAIVVETTLLDFLVAPTFSQMNPKAAAKSLIAWSVKYRIPVFFAGNRQAGNALTGHLLEKYFRYHGVKKLGKESE